MSAAQHPTVIGIDEYLAGEELCATKHEYLGGVVHAMAGGSNGHNAIAGNAFGWFYGALKGKPCRPFNSDTKVRIELTGQTRFYYPDAMVVCHPNPRSDHFQDQPVVVIEVLSDSTRRIDQGEKCDVYLRIPTLRVLALVESSEVAVTVHRRAGDGQFNLEYYSGLEAVIPLQEIGADLPLAELYQGDAFPGS